MQKNTSIHLKVMWKYDPFKTKWAIVARAYSSIRDVVGKTNAPLKTFLELVCPEIGIISVDEYLTKMEWNVVVEDNNSVCLQRKSSSTQLSFAFNIVQTSMTDNDVIHFCSQRGYISARNAALAIQGKGVSRTASIPRVTLQHGAAVSVPQTATTSPGFPVSAASNVLGFDVTRPTDSSESTNAGHQQPSEPAHHQWSGSLSDLHTPFEGSYSLEPFCTAYNDGNSDGSWYRAMDMDPLDINDPRAYDAMLENFGAESLVPSSRSSGSRTTQCS